MHTAPSARQLARYFREAEFMVSAAKFSQCPKNASTEVAFAGRSNAGKSSAINLICDQKRLARTSKTPGRTQLLNFFALQDGRQLVDLPGYGYAKVSESKKREWQQQLGRYLEQRDALALLVLLVDCRHELQPYDRMMLEWVDRCQLPCHVLLTKADKLSRNKAQQALFALQRELAVIKRTSAQLFSAHSGEGLDEARAAIYAALVNTD
ncbi:MAG: ribosome biogenesis GTP-binding protein YihA/YsxC [Gammaproteobacteria bacterium]|nr:ribosome biogenesis GTP-binding protein YihA/YsxC [Gammaproteobacteria bacterium]MBT8151791.1 ribosome biogenesis GTP-binding protein YihA/YsxC [Gammaproteobacteria bacterium]NND39339.1 YihA family ribosome biogenesis GTP-binding protein [Pseudomonadales bacterium]NNM12059.1 YihA family ribosome biogenesis GTP-binding protein [Pseudomonadales bacterium]RZV50405.1 MAG: YihA family ribosome biogenesis GTP-binding protein [Pseudomonadales bacterium]